VVLPRERGEPPPPLGLGGGASPPGRRARGAPRPARAS